MASRKKDNLDSRKLWDEDPNRIPLQKSRKRALVVNTIVLFGFAVIFLRLVDLMVIDHKMLSSRAERQYSRQEKLQSHRGVIWDRKMREMAASVDSSSLYAVPSKISDTRNLARKLAPVIKTTSKQLNMTLVNKKDKDFIWLARKMNVSTVEEVSSVRDGLGLGRKELGFISESSRYYPKRQTAAHVIGFSNIDNKGIAGIELYYNEYLQGRQEKVSYNTDAKGNRLSDELKEGIPGHNIILTIDEGIQYIVERELSDAMQQWNASAAIAVMMNPWTGEILAMANRPTYDPNLANNSRAQDRRNRALTDLYEPGSTLKAMLAASALEEKLYDPSDKFDVSQGYIEVGGKRIRDIHKFDILTFTEVFKRSSNVGSVQIGLKLGAKDYHSYLKKFGFGSKTGIDFPGEVSGIFRDLKRWSGTSLAALSIGQEIGVTPLQILRAYSAIANGGALVKPYLVSDIISADGQVIKSVRPEIERQVISRETARVTTEILKTVVEEGGTAMRADIHGNLVAGKTGTAQIFDSKTGQYSKDKFVSSFVGFVPADDPLLALIVVVYEPDGRGYGGVVAAPVFRKIVENTFTYLDVPMERDENQILLVSQ